MPVWTTWGRGTIHIAPAVIRTTIPWVETRSVVTIVTELSSGYFDLDAVSWNSDDRRAENFDKSSAQLSVLRACDTGLLVESNQTFRIKASGSSSRIEVSTKTQKIFVVTKCQIFSTYDI